MAQRKRRYLLALVLLLAAGLGMMLAYAVRKQGYHVDELYTYELINYPGGVLCPAAGVSGPMAGRHALPERPASPALCLCHRLETTRRPTCIRRCITARC